MNNKIIKSCLVATALSYGLVMTSSVQAEGAYIFGNISSTGLGHSIERSIDSDAGLPVPDAGGVSSVEDSDFAVGIGIGYRADLNEDVFVGVEGFYDRIDNSSRNVNGVLVTDIDLKSSYGIRLLSGVNVNEKFSIYAHIGYTEINYDIRNSYTFAPPVRERSDTEGSLSFGLGADYAFNEKYSVYTQYSQTTDVKFNGIAELAGGTGRVNPNELDLSQLTIGIKYSF